LSGGEIIGTPDRAAAIRAGLPRAQLRMNCDSRAPTGHHVSFREVALGLRPLRYSRNEGDRSTEWWSERALPPAMIITDERARTEIAHVRIDDAG
jgi:hypothetical protein